MPPRQKSLTRGSWRAFVLSLLLHSAIVASAVLAWKYWKRTPPPVETAAIEGTLVDPSVLKGAQAKPAPEPEPQPAPPPEPEPLPPPEPEEQGPPKPDPAEIERREEEERQKQQKIEQAEREQQEKAEQERKAEREKAQREEAEKVAAAKAAAEKAAADAKKRLDAEKEKKRVADELAAKKAADEKARLAREAELRRSLEAEERGRALQNSDEAARWHASIVAKIQRAWLKPPSAQPGISCTVSVSQVPGGEVTSVRVDSCSGGDAALRDSVRDAVLRASPLPEPPDPALFERNLELTFAPTS